MFFNDSQLFFSSFLLLEFSAVLLNAKTGLVESKFYRSIEPFHMPNFCEICFHRNYIKQPSLYETYPLCVVHHDFLQWLQDMTNGKHLSFATPNKKFANSRVNAAICTWLESDLLRFFRIDCAKYLLDRPLCCNVWIDLQSKFEVSVVECKFLFLFYHKKK